MIPNGRGSRIRTCERVKVPPGKRDVLIFDGGHEDAVRGFGIRKSASGEAYYFVKYNIGRKQRRQSLGSVTRGNGYARAG